VGLRADRAALRRLRSADVTVPEIVAIFSDTVYDPDVRREAIRHPACTLTAIQYVLDIGSDLILIRIAMDAHDPQVLAYVARNGPADRRAIVAYNADTPPWLLAELARDEDPIVRGNAHINPSTPADAVALLENDDDEDVRTVRETWWPYFEGLDRDPRARLWGAVWAAQSWALRRAL
jgi:hypothetical protein